MRPLHSMPSRLMATRVYINQLLMFAAELHYYTNPTCQTVQFTGTFPFGTNTQFIFLALDAFPSRVLFYLNGTLPTPYAYNPGNPAQDLFQSDPACVQTCAGTNDPKTGCFLYG
eukprot:jgi/Chrzof1/5605/Cz16g08260.t1